jgi:hypothetical protein
MIDYIVPVKFQHLVKYKNDYNEAGCMKDHENFSIQQQSNKQQLQASQSVTTAEHFPSFCNSELVIQDQTYFIQKLVTIMLNSSFRQFFPRPAIHSRK